MMAMGEAGDDAVTDILGVGRETGDCGATVSIIVASCASRKHHRWLTCREWGAHNLILSMIAIDRFPPR